MADGPELIDGIAVPMVAGEEYFVAKFSPGGRCQWVHQIENPWHVTPKIGSDPSGNWYVAARDANSGLYLQKLSKDGNILWTKREGNGQGAPVHPRFLVATGDRVYLSGHPASVFASMDPLDQGSFLASLTSDGEVVWVSSVDYPNLAVAVGSTGAIWAVSPLTAETFGSEGTLRSASKLDDTLHATIAAINASGFAYLVDWTSTLLSKVDADGNSIWERRSQEASSYSCLTCQDATCYVAGGTPELSVLSTPSSLAFLSRVDSAPLQILIIRAGSTAMVSWPVTPQATLESSTVIQPAAWAPVTKTNSIVEDLNIISESMGDGSRFYRLRVQQ